MVLGLALWLSSGCNMESPMAMLEHLEKTQSALQAAAGVETVSVNVRNTSMAVTAVDEKFERIKEDDRKKVAENLAITALQYWPDKWPITNVDVYIAYPSGELGTQGETYSYKPSDLDLSSTPAPATPTPQISESPK